MKHRLAMICLCVVWTTATTVRAGPRPDQVATALEAIDSAKAVAKAGRGSLLMVGSILSSESSARDEVVVVLDNPVLRDMRPGMILILAKIDCEPIDHCLIARRVTDVTAKEGIETEPYGGAEGLLLTRIKATLLGSVAYAVDLGTGAIRNLRVDRAREALTLEEAVARELARARRTSGDDRDAGGV
jgi:hypothetical protein